VQRSTTGAQNDIDKLCCNHVLHLTGDFRGPFRGPFYSLKPGVSRGPPGLSGGQASSCPSRTFSSVRAVDLSLYGTKNRRRSSEYRNEYDCCHEDEGTCRSPICLHRLVG